MISPAFKGFLQPENEKLICRAGDSLFVLERQNGGVETRHYPHSEIFLLETGTILLISWYTLRGIDPSGAAAVSTIKFNSVTEHLFAPSVERFRAAFKPAGKAAAPAGETSPFDALADDNSKFMNHGRWTLPPGKPVLQMILQPDIRETVFAFAGYTLTRRIAPAHLAILIENELIWIRDDPSRQMKTKTLHGASWNYIPLSKIESVSPAPGENDLVELTVHLTKIQTCDCFI